MSIEKTIAALLDKAAPLRLLPDDEAEAAGLQGIILEINSLRAKQARGEDIEESPEPAEVKRGPGRPRKAE